MKKGDYYLYAPFVCAGINYSNTARCNAAMKIDWKRYCDIEPSLYPCIFRIK